MIGVAIGEQILDLRRAAATGGWTEAIAAVLKPLANGQLNPLMAQSTAARTALRLALSKALAEGSAQQAGAAALSAADRRGRTGAALRRSATTPISIPASITPPRVGKLFRPDNPLLPNYKWVPIGYHGRASSIDVSGQTFARPKGQTAGEQGQPPDFGPSQRLDYELELGFFVGRSNLLGEPVPIAEAEDHLFGVTLLNDWSARDLQAWEYQPLGPFLAKNFATTISPWVVTTRGAGSLSQRLRTPCWRPAAAALSRQRGQPPARAPSTLRSKSGCRPQACAMPDRGRSGSANPAAPRRRTGLRPSC